MKHNFMCTVGAINKFQRSGLCLKKKAKTRGAGSGPQRFTQGRSLVWELLWRCWRYREGSRGLVEGAGTGEAWNLAWSMKPLHLWFLPRPGGAPKKAQPARDVSVSLVLITSPHKSRFVSAL